MKNVFSAVAVAVAVALTAFTSLEKAPVAYKIDTKQSVINWHGKKVAGEHNGTIKIADGTLNVDGKTVKSGVVNLDMTSIADDDIKDAGMNARLVGHLKSDDWFAAEKYPTSKFEITKMAPNTKAAGKDNYDVTGNLTIKGITKEVTFPATVVVSGNKLTANGKFKLDRTKWEVKYGSNLIGTAADKLIDNDFDVTLNIVATK